MGSSVQFITEYAPAYAFLCLLAGVGYAWLLYTKSAPWGRATNYLLAGARTVLVTLVALLLLGIFIRQAKNRYEDPIWVLAIDNSRSLPLLNDSAKVQENTARLRAMKTSLREAGFDVAVRTLSDTPAEGEPIRYDAPSTNLSAMLRDIQTEYEGANLRGAVLYSDGIFNLGTPPDFTPYNFQVHTVGIGDTVPRRDLNLRAVQANRLAYLGNKFPLVAELTHNGFAGQTVEVTLAAGGEVLERKSVQFGADPQAVSEVRFLVEAKKTGMQRFVVGITPQEGEFTTANNRRNVYVEVLDDKQKMLIAAAVPHPDVKALRSAIGTNKNYEIDVAIPGIFPLDRTEKYDLVIFHQIPHRSGRARQLHEQLKAQDIPKAYIIGTQTNLQVFNTLPTGITVNQLGIESDQVTPAYNDNFDRFTFGDERKEVFREYPPVRVPFGRYEVSGSAQVLLFQRVGSIKTDKPLLTVNETPNEKVGVFLGDGLWRWRLQEYALEQEQTSFDELLEKWVQYLVARQDKRRFRVRTTDAEFATSEPVQFEVETYNEIYEPITGKNIELRVTDEAGKDRLYSFVNTTPNFLYRLRNLPEGVYNYEASTRLGGTTKTSSGQFTVRQLQLEALNTTADFALLQRLARNNGGTFFTSDQLSSLQDSLLSVSAKPRVHVSEERTQILDLPWLLVLIVLLASLEWFFRKFKGGY